VRADWSTPVGLLLLTGSSFAPVPWATLLFVFFVHEMGHAVVVRARRLHVLELRLHGLGGECAYNAAYATRLGRIFIAWGGPLAQVVLFALALLVRRYAPTTSPATLAILDMLTSTNALILALNLLPLPPLDGWTAWQILDPRPLYRAWKRAAGRALFRSRGWPSSEALAFRENLRRAALAKDNPRYGRSKPDEHVLLGRTEPPFRALAPETARDYLPGPLERAGKKELSSWLPRSESTASVASAAASCARLPNATSKTSSSSRSTI
jgi:hypothetical protein